MKVEIRIYLWLALFFVVMAVIYGWSTWKYAGGIEWVGAPALLLTGLLAGMIGWYLGMTAKRIDARPEDDKDGEIADLSGEYGTFSPHSWWPLPLAFGAALLFTGLAVGWWVFFIGVGVGALALVGWVFEYYMGANAH